MFSIQSGQVGADTLLSHLVMGFIERRVAPQTIADVLLAQLSENGAVPEELKPATWNGVVEALAASQPVTGLFDILLFAAKRSDFPFFLSSSATIGGLASLLASPIHLAERCQSGDQHMPKLLEALARRAADIVAREPQSQTRGARMRLINGLKSSSTLINSLSSLSPSLMILRQLLLRAPVGSAEPSTGSGFPSLGALLAAVANTPDHVLVHHNAADYSVRNWTRSDFPESAVDDICGAIEDQARPLSSFQTAFVIEWLFTGAVASGFTLASSTGSIGRALRQVIGRLGLRLDVLKGVVRALQRDISIAVGRLPVNSTSDDKLKMAQYAASLLFGALLAAKKPRWPQLAVEFVPWVLHLPCSPAESRIVTREQLEWLRVLDVQEWLEGLSAPPAWITADASQTAALVFHLAPGQWLQHHAGGFIEVLHQETLGADFVMTKAHFDCVDYLIRTARKKAPIFASEIDTLIALQVLGRAQEGEQNQIKLAVARLRMLSAQDGAPRSAAQASLGLLTNPQAVERLGPNPLARALSIFSSTAQAVQAKGVRDFEKRQFLSSGSLRPASKSR